MAIKRQSWDQAKLGLGKSKYPWATWLDGSVWEVEVEKDFKCRTDSFVTMTHDAAAKRGGKDRTRKLKNGNVLIQFFKS